MNLGLSSRLDSGSLRISVSVPCHFYRTSGGSDSKESACMQGTQGSVPGSEDLLKKGMVFPEL